MSITDSVTNSTTNRLVFVSGPLNSSGSVDDNIRNACLVGHYLIERGFVPYVPHLSFFWNMMHKRDEGYWMEHDKRVILHCVAVLRLPGESRGADEEVEFAGQNGIKVMYLKDVSVPSIGDTIDKLATIGTDSSVTILYGLYRPIFARQYGVFYKCSEHVAIAVHYGVSNLYDDAVQYARMFAENHNAEMHGGTATLASAPPRTDVITREET